jgi:alcohol dehydrogenase (cytochrome c)
MILILCLAVSVVAAQQRPAPEGGPAPAFKPVTYDRLLKADAEPGNWLMHHGQLNGQRFSRLNQVTRQNVGQLEMKWAYQLGALDRAETTPLVVDGVMFVTEAPVTVIALDARTGRPYWRYAHPQPPPEELRACCGRNARGVAILDDRLFMSTLDAHLISIDAKTGNLLWDAEVGPMKDGYAKTDTPLVVRGNKIVTGIAGGEFGIRGFLDAYDAKTGKREWRAYTIPGPDHPDNRSWAGDSWRTGGAPTWVTGSYDPQLNLVYWGTGNPGPDWNGDVRQGDNLYSDSVLAVDADSGELKWYFQFTPHDVHDWDATQVPVLADLPWRGQQRKLMLWANRNSFFYVLDRATGEFLSGKPFALQTWAEGLDAKGRPIRRPNTFPTVEGTIVAPPAIGGTNWFSPTFSPQTRLFYVMAYDGEGKYFIRTDEYEPGKRFWGGGFERVNPEESYVSAVRAIDPQTLDVKWEYKVQPRSQSGLLATAGDVVFGGAIDGYFFALDAVTGQEVWHVNLGARVQAAPISYLANGRQYISIAAGNVLFTFGLREN